MQLKDAFIRAARTALQTFVGSAAVGALAAARDIAGVKNAGIAAVTALVLALAAGIVSFLQNVAEDNTAAQLPK